MKRIVSLFALAYVCTFLPLSAQAQTTATKLPVAEENLVVSQPGVQDIFLLIGQSNMAGCAPIGELDETVLDDVYLFNGQEQWEKAANTVAGLNRYSTVETRLRPNSLNPAYSFGRKIAEYTGRKIGLVSNARGGTRISWWQEGYTGKDDFDLYENAVARTKAALAASPGAALKGILWHQGEGDNGVASAAAYPAELEKLVASLRADLNVPQAVFIAGEVGTWKGRGARVNPQIQQIAQTVPHSDFASSQGLTSINLPKNDPHFDTLSQRVLGERYADKVLEMVYGTSPGVATLFSGTDFTGRSVILRAGSYSPVELEKQGILLSELTSVKIQNGYKLIVQSTESGQTLYETGSDAAQIPSETLQALFLSLRIVADQ